MIRPSNFNTIYNRAFYCGGEYDITKLSDQSLRNYLKCASLKGCRFSRVQARANYVQNHKKREVNLIYTTLTQAMAHVQA